jgi:Ca2+-dependent lipid-binding protein
MATSVEFGGIAPISESSSPNLHSPRRISVANQSMMSVSSNFSVDDLAGKFVCSNCVEFSGEGKITILEARNLKSVDANGLSDPYVRVTQKYHGKSRTLFKTDAIKKSLNPVWTKNAEFKFKAPPVLHYLTTRPY